MQEKEKIILESAIQLFAQKGFSGTSIQEIADESGISKGSVYSYYKSKDALLIETLNYYFIKIETRLMEIEKLSVTPEEKLLKQIDALFHEIFAFREILNTKAYDQDIPIYDEVRSVLFQKQNDLRALYQKNFLLIYGEKVSPYSWDLSLMLEGIFYSFIHMFSYDDQSLNIRDLSIYIMSRLDDMTKGLIEKKDSPVFSEIKVAKISQLVGMNDFLWGEKVAYILKKMKVEFSKGNCHEDCLIAVEVLEEELLREEPRHVVIQSMIQSLMEQGSGEQLVNELNELIQRKRGKPNN